MTKNEIVLSSTDGTVPSRADIEHELLAWWDGYSILSLSTLKQACDAGNTLDEVGVDEFEAQGSASKYNSIITRAPGGGPLVAPSEAKAWAGTAMKKIIDEVTLRAQP